MSPTSNRSHYRAAAPRPLTYYLLTLGCPKNQVDSEGMAMLMLQRGFGSTAAPDEADVLIVNTCGFLEAAKEESIAALRTLGKRKRSDQILIAAGCLAQRNGAEIARRVPRVDGLLGTRRWMEIVEMVETLRGGRSQRGQGRYELLGDAAQAAPEATPRPGVAAGSAYLKISDGCNAPCAFCSIPSFKGKLRSRSFDGIVAEAQALTAAGARELIVIAQDTTDYGRDRNERNRLPALLTAICQRAAGLHWLRLMYAYPGHVTDELIETMASQPQIIPYLDMPLQHGHPETLKRMRRPSSREWVSKTVGKLRNALPNLALRSTFIVGFPGESEEEFQTLLDFVQEVQFDRLGAFTFSAEPGTAAYDMPNQVAEEIAEERRQRLLSVQQPISLARNQAQVGRTLDVLIEGFDNGYSLGRSYRDAPEVDGLVLMPGMHPVGEILPVRIDSALEYDLAGEVVARRKLDDPAAVRVSRRADGSASPFAVRLAADAADSAPASAPAGAATVPAGY